MRLEGHWSNWTEASEKQSMSWGIDHDTCKRSSLWQVLSQKKPRPLGSGFYKNHDSGKDIISFKMCFSALLHRAEIQFSRQEYNAENWKWHMMPPSSPEPWKGTRMVKHFIAPGTWLSRLDMARTTSYAPNMTGRATTDNTEVKQPLKW